MDPTKVSIAVAFDAHVLKWSLDNNPPDEYARHHIKEASIYGHNVWTADFTVKIPEESDGKIKFNYVGINEKAMWPAKKAQKEEGGRGIDVFYTITTPNLLYFIITIKICSFILLLKYFL